MAAALIDSIMDYGGTQSQNSRDIVADNDKIRYIYGFNDHVTVSILID